MSGDFFIKVIFILLWANTYNHNFMVVTLCEKLYNITKLILLRNCRFKKVISVFP